MSIAVVLNLLPMATSLRAIRASSVATGPVSKTLHLNFKPSHTASQP
jgi:hypothetical protein